ncbi:MAG: zinc ribbon domain-containing protein [Nitrospinae bacterium]|nr:zinc ribbon domain-containing protein [Nitrospinota bacterium]
MEPIGSSSHPKGMIEEFCPKCGKPNVSQSAWCEYCLTYFNEYGKDVTLYCPECSHPNDYNSSHCEVCYEPLKPGQVE